MTRRPGGFSSEKPSSRVGVSAQTRCLMATDTGVILLSVIPLRTDPIIKDRLSEMGEFLTYVGEGLCCFQTQLNEIQQQLLHLPTEENQQQ